MYDVNEQIYTINFISTQRKTQMFNISANQHLRWSAEIEQGGGTVDTALKMNGFYKY